MREGVEREAVRLQAGRGVGIRQSPEEVKLGVRVRIGVRLRVKVRVGVRVRAAGARPAEGRAEGSRAIARRCP